MTVLCIILYMLVVTYFCAYKVEILPTLAFSALLVLLITALFDRLCGAHRDETGNFHVRPDFQPHFK